MIDRATAATTHSALVVHNLNLAQALARRLDEQLVVECAAQLDQVRALIAQVKQGLTANFMKPTVWPTPRISFNAESCMNAGFKNLPGKRKPIEPQVLAGQKILIVDDLKDITSLMADTFALVGAQTVQVNNGTEAMGHLRAGGFAIVVLDMVMPQPDGWRVLEFMRSRPDWLQRTIILSANRYDPHVAQAIREYGVAHLFKPFLLTDLIAMAGSLLTKIEYATII
jgi:CheY-like chemotaxis protein